MSELRSEHVSLSYGDHEIVHDLSLSFPEGAITTIIGPSGCGKSTLLRGLARLLRPSGGAVLLDGQLIHQLPTREVARRLGLLHQQSIPSAGVTVEDLVWRGRYPHQSFLQPPSKRDADAVEHALELTGMTALRTRAVDQLSGGQRQRAWIAMTLAQETPLLLLDEPTTYLDVAHQLEVIDLARRLNVEEGRTVIMVLHDINDAARVSDRIVAMKDGRIVHEGTPAEILDPTLLAEVYGINCDIYTHPESGQPFCVPLSASTDSAPTGQDERPSLSFGINDLQVGYEGRCVLRDLTLALPAGAITAIVGPNACGKSTLLRSCARLLKPEAGVVMLGESDVRQGSHRALARQLSLLAQGSAPPSGFLVEDLIAAGRLPHQGFFKRWRIEDEVKVESALCRCGLAEMRYCEVNELSGGQRQRAWLGMTLAQDTPVILLDEPTTFLDIAAQIDLLDLVRELNHERGRTVVMILHDLNLAARYADLLVAMKDGKVVAAGRPHDVISEPLLRDVFSIEASIITDPRTGAPLVLPTRTFHEAAPDAEALDDLSGELVLQGSFEGSSSVAGL